MYTQCPGCLTIFRVPVDALAQAHGRARCGVCRAEFDILAALSEHLPEQSDGMLPRRGPGPVPLLSLAAPRPRSGQRELFVAVDSVPEAAPAFVSAAPLPRPAPRRRRSVWHWANAALIAFLAKLLGVRKGDVIQTAGQTSREKRFRIEGVDDGALICFQNALSGLEI